jgi:hypothetical protein
MAGEDFAGFSLETSMDLERPTRLRDGPMASRTKHGRGRRTCQVGIQSLQQERVAHQVTRLGHRTLAVERQG